MAYLKRELVALIAAGAVLILISTFLRFPIWLGGLVSILTYAGTRMLFTVSQVTEIDEHRKQLRQIAAATAGLSRRCKRLPQSPARAEGMQLIAVLDQFRDRLSGPVEDRPASNGVLDHIAHLSRLLDKLLRVVDAQVETGASDRRRFVPTAQIFRQTRELYEARLEQSVRLEEKIDDFSAEARFNEELINLEQEFEDFDP
ncbi:MAG: hypothetical protein AAF236_04505 [Verrucomicrobiota bacterium]